MRTALIAPALLAVLLTGCASTTGAADDTPAAGSNRPSESSTPEEELVEDPTEAPEAPSGPLAFGETFTYEDGLGVTVGPPTPIERGEYFAGGGDFTATVGFDITIVNGTTANFEPGLFFASVQSANVEGAEVYDENLVGAPSTVLLPGREATFRLGFGVADPADIVMEANVDFTHKPAIYATAP